ncbi:hypothetical protein CPT_Solomon_073 [Klebsiella phage Solomon]|uniref:Uncharacterized protein n=1 Tax=Klebsiella phage Solomon TaxID=2767583 RepID=A0A873WPD2_9CAUD|nr:hypothetical protein CPT_Solomon_073 [Klebsiella phage Solomon]
MKVSKKKMTLYWAFFLVGLSLHNYAGWEAIGMLCAIIGVSRLSEISGFRRGHRAAFSGDKE